MRIIGGTARSLPLKTVDGTETRPTTDRTKETLFNILGDEVRDSVFLDLFAGSGSVGLEAVSRGASEAVFVDHSRRAAACIRDNIDFTGFGGQCELICADFRKAIKEMEGRYSFDIVFLDPPYGKGLAEQALGLLRQSSLCADGTLFVVEESIGFDPEELTRAGYEVARDKKYKTNRHIFLKRN